MHRYSIQATIRVLLLLVFAVGMVACATSRSTVSPPSGRLPAAFPGHSAESIESALHAAGDSLKSYEASGDVQLRTPKESSSYRIHLQQRTGDSLLVRLSPGLGIVAARGLATHDSVFVYDRFHHRLYYGALASVGRVLPDLASLSALFDNLTGTFTPSAAKPWEVRSDSTHYLLSTRETGRLHRMTIDPRFWRVIRYEVRTVQGTLLEERRFSDFRRVDGVYVPHVITVRRPQQDTVLKLTYDEIRPNPDHLAFSFVVAPGVERIPITQQIE